LKTFLAMRSSMIDDKHLNLKWVQFCCQLILGFGISENPKIKGVLRPNQSKRRKKCLKLFKP
jgi:hypothetical protein